MITEYTYDAEGRLLKEVQRDTAADGIIHSFKYDDYEYPASDLLEADNALIIDSRTGKVEESPKPQDFPKPEEEIKLPWGWEQARSIDPKTGRWIDGSPMGDENGNDNFFPYPKPDNK